MTIDEIIADIKYQLDWRGPGGQPQGHVVMPRKDAEMLLEALSKKKEEPCPTPSIAQSASG